MNDERKKADEIVRALREEYKETDKVYFFLRTLLKDAADMIENQQSKLTDYHHMKQMVDGKMSENQRLRRINENLQAQLSLSQRREKAAVEDIYRISACDACKHYDPDENACAKPLADSNTCFEWRGPQEAEKGEAE